jgi:hypothetical protein
MPIRAPISLSLSASEPNIGAKVPESGNHSQNETKIITESLTRTGKEAKKGAVNDCSGYIVNGEGAKYQNGANDVAKNHDVENAKAVQQKIRHYSSYHTTPIDNGNLTIK